MGLKFGRNDGLLVVPDLDVEVRFNIHLLKQVMVYMKTGSNL